MIYLNLLLSMSLYLYSTIVFSCPAYLSRESFKEDLPNSPRNYFGLFSWDSKKWTQLPLQIDPVSRDGRLLFFEGDDSFKDWEIDEKDRISFLSEGFDKRIDDKAPPPCDGDFIYEIKDPTGRYVYLADCGPGTTEKVKSNYPIVHDKETFTVNSKVYDYKYHPKNHMMFDQITVKPEGKEPFAAGSNSVQRIRVDVKKFFTLDFSNDDIESKLRQVREGPIALLGQLTFFLRILFFKIDLQLNTVVSFFEDSVHLPLTINMPVDATKATNPGTGMYFVWEIPEGIEWDRELSTMPALNPEKIKLGYKELGKLGLKNCRFSYCKFSLVGKLNDFKWSTEFNIPQTMVQNGFFPMFMENAGEDLVKLGWDKKDPFKIRNSGVYYDTSGLTKGQHEFDFWIKIGDKSKSVQRDCPHRVKVVRRLPVSEKIKKLLNRGLEDDIFFVKTESEIETGIERISTATKWQEFLDQLDYDVDVASFSKSYNFKKYDVLALVSDSKTQRIKSLLNATDSIVISTDDSETKLEEGMKSVHLVLVKKSRKKLVMDSK